MGILVVYAGLCIGIGLMADSFGRGAIGYFFLAALLSPILALITLLIQGRSADVQAKRAAAVKTATEKLLEAKES